MSSGRNVSLSKMKIAIEDLLNIRLAADPQIAPDGQRVAYVVTRVSKEHNRYFSAIWMTDPSNSSEPVQFTSGQTQDRGPKWSPDGNYLGFNSERSGRAQVHVIPADGGEAWQVTESPNPVESFTWAPDNISLYYVSKVDEEHPPGSDTKVITSLIYRLDGSGYFDGKRRQIFSISLNGGEAKQVTSGDWHSTSPVVSPDGSTLAFVSNRTTDRDDNRFSAVWIQDLASGEPAAITPENGSYDSPSWSPDGAQLAYTGHDFSDVFGATTQPILYVYDLSTRDTIELMTDADRAPGNSAIADMRYNVPAQLPVWESDGTAIASLVSTQGNVEIWSCPLVGNPETLVGGVKDIQSFSMAADGAVVFASSTMTTPPEIYLSREGANEVRLTSINEQWLESIEMSAVEEIYFESDPGVTVHGWLLKPPGFNSAVKYPAIIEVHGGPHGMYGTGFFHEMQVLAARGYVVLMTNPRGSSGYGQRWTAGTHGDWGGADYRDVMAGADLLEQLDYVDDSRIGITGGSYGGYMVNWAITQTDRFKAAVSQRSTANRTSLYGTSDINMTYNNWEFAGSPYDNPELYRERSPLTYVKQVKTPLLLIHSENDLRCPITQSEEFYTALKLCGQTVEFVRFPDESHGMSRTGQPIHRIERLERLCAWFDRYL